MDERIEDKRWSHAFKVLQARTQNDKAKLKFVQELWRRVTGATDPPQLTAKIFETLEQPQLITDEAVAIIQELLCKAETEGHHSVRHTAKRAAEAFKAFQVWVPDAVIDVVNHTDAKLREASAPERCNFKHNKDKLMNEIEEFGMNEFFKGMLKPPTAFREEVEPALMRFLGSVDGAACPGTLLKGQSSMCLAEITRKHLAAVSSLDDADLFQELLRSRACGAFMLAAGLRQGDLLRLKLDDLTLASDHNLLARYRSEKADKDFVAYAGCHVDALCCPVAHVALLVTFNQTRGRGQPGDAAFVLPGQTERTCKERFNALLIAREIVAGIKVESNGPRGHIFRALTATLLTRHGASAEAIEAHSGWAGRSIRTVHYVNDNAKYRRQECIDIMRGLVHEHKGAVVPLEAALEVSLPVELRAAAGLDSSEGIVGQLRHVAVAFVGLLSESQRREHGYDIWAKVVCPKMRESDWGTLHKLLNKAVKRAEAESAKGLTKTQLKRKYTVLCAERAERDDKIAQQAREIAQLRTELKRRRQGEFALECSTQPKEEMEEAPRQATTAAPLAAILARGVVEERTKEVRDAIRNFVQANIEPIIAYKPSGPHSLDVQLLQMCHDLVFASNRYLGKRSFLEILNDLSVAKPGCKMSNFGLSNKGQRGKQWWSVLLVAAAVRRAGGAQCLYATLEADTAGSLSRFRSWRGLADHLHNNGHRVFAGVNRGSLEAYKQCTTLMK